MSVAQRIWRIFLDFAETIVIAGAIFVVVYAFLFRPFQVNGNSMFPTFQNGEYIFTNLITLRISPLKRGDVVVFKAPANQEKDYIKRIIGLPGDTVQIKDGYVYVNGQLLNEPYEPKEYRTTGEAFMQDGQTVTVPQESYFVLGDNRPGSSDSRDWGFVTKNKIIGKSFFVYWPITRARLVQEITY